MERKPTEIRQEEIKRAFLEIVDSEGLHNLSTRKLAEKVGVTEGALFRHFKSKRDIVLSIVDSVEQVLMNSLQNIAMSNGNILNLQRQLAKKIIQDGIVSGEWDSSIQVENVAMLYMGIPISLNIELILNPYGVNTDNFCKRMMCLLERALKKTQ
jgi:AcrR family transcriptional regulator